MLSVIIPLSGTDPLLWRNYSLLAACLDRQTYRECEIIIVEQSSAGFLFPSLGRVPALRTLYVPVSYDGPFNQWWCVNQGAREARGEVIVCLDADIMFADDYLERISREFAGPYAMGWNYMIWLNQAGTRKYGACHRFQAQWAEGHVERQRADMKGDAAQGGSNIFEREWFFEVFGGYCEDFFRWGGADCEAMNRAEALAGAWLTFHATLLHLHHKTRQPEGSATGTLLAISRENPLDFARRVRDAGVGKQSGPEMVVSQEEIVACTSFSTG